MKTLLLILVVVFGTCSAQNDLTNDFIDFGNIMPMEEIDALTAKYLEYEEFVAIVMYVAYSEEFKEIVLGLEKIPEYRELLKFLDGSGLEVYAYLNLLHEAIGLPPLDLPDTSSYKLNAVAARNILQQLRDEVRALLPKKEITELHDLKMVESPAFQYFAQRLESREMEVIVKNLKIIKNIRTTPIL